MSRLLIALVLGTCATTATAQEYVNGYTYVAPSYYLAPPVVTTAPGYVAAPYYTAQPYVVQRPYYQAPAPYLVSGSPVVNAPLAPGYYRERVKVRPREIEYKVRGPNGYREKVEIEYHRRGVEVEYKRR